MKRYYSFILIAFVFSAVSCNKEIVDESAPNNDLIHLQDYLATEIIDDLSYNGDYLEFKSKEIYDSIRNVLDNMEYSDFVKWEKNIGFKSARTWRDEFENTLSESKSQENFDSVMKKYSDYFDTDNDQVIRYKFYAESLDRILNINGVVKIGKSLYKFTKDNEYISYDGNIQRIKDAINGKNQKSLNLDDDKLLFSLKSNNLKSTYDNIVIEGLKTVTAADRRLIYSIHKVAYSTIYAVDIYNGGVLYEWGYGLNLTMRQQKYSWLFGYSWRNMSACYSVRDIFIDWAELSYGPEFTGSKSNKDFSSTSSEVKYWFVDVGYRGYYLGSADFVCRSLDVSFFSSGIGEANKISIHLTQAF
jgi:hypothetical protein